MTLTFVVSAVHFYHHVVQFLLLQHTDPLTENQNVCLHNSSSIFALLLHFHSKWIKFCTHRLQEGWSKGVINVTNSFGYTLRQQERGKHLDPWKTNVVIADIYVAQPHIKKAETKAETRKRSVHLCPYSESCLHHGAPEPHRCRWMHRWGQQPWTDLGLERRGWVGGGRGACLGGGEKGGKGTGKLTTLWFFFFFLRIRLHCKAH